MVGTRLVILRVGELQRQLRGLDVPVLFVEMFFRATASCSAI